MEPILKKQKSTCHLNKAFDIGRHANVISAYRADHLDAYPDVLGACKALGYDSSKVKVLVHQFVTIQEKEIDGSLITEREGWLRQSPTTYVVTYLDESSEGLGYNYRYTYRFNKENPSMFTFQAEIKDLEGIWRANEYSMNDYITCKKIEN